MCVFIDDGEPGTWADALPYFSGQVVNPSPRRIELGRCVAIKYLACHTDDFSSGAFSGFTSEGAAAADGGSAVEAAAPSYWRFDTAASRNCVLLCGSLSFHGVGYD